MESAIKNINCKGYLVSLHCQRSMDVRNVSLDEVIDTVNFGEVIEKYDADKPYPSKLILKFVNNRPLHVVVSQDPFSLRCILITAYWPDPYKWQPDFKTRKKVQ